MVHYSTTEGSTSKFPRQMVALIAAATLLVGGTAVYVIGRSSLSTANSPSEPVVPVPRTVTALGRLEPGGEVVTLSAPTSTEGNRVDQLLVEEGDRVRKGQVIANLDSRDRLQAALEQAEEQVRVAQANLARVQAGARRGEIESQQATIARIEAEKIGDLEAQAATVERLSAELDNARIEAQRYEDLYREGAISESQRDSKRLTLDTAREKLEEAEANLSRARSSRQAQIGEARATLDRIAEVRPVDVDVAAAEVRSAQAAAKQAKARLELAYVRAPQDGQILKVFSRPGELIGNSGVVEIGQTDRMYAIAEVYESDVSRVRVGQPVKVTSDSLPGVLTGTVERIGLRVQKQTVVNTDPAANLDARVVEVRVRLDPASSKQAASFTNLQTTVVISTP